MITNEKIEQGWLRDPSLWEINVLKHLASTRLIEHLNPNCFLPLPLPLVLAISVPNKWRNSSALLELQLQCWWNLELCYYVTTTSLQPYGPNPHNLLTWYTPPSGAVAVPKKTAFSQRVRPFWRDTCADLIMTLTVIGRNWLNPAHVLGWSYHFTKKKCTSSFYCSNIFAYNVTQPQKIGKNRWPEDLFMFFSPKTQVTGGFAKGTKLRIRCFWDVPATVRMIFSESLPLKMLGCLFFWRSGGTFCAEFFHLNLKI